MADTYIGTYIGKYKVVRPIGRGGYGVVFEVVQQNIGHRAAAKLLAPSLTAEAKQLKFVERFVDEARAVNLIDHPGVLKIFDLGELPDKTMYILMEYLEGETLHARLDRMHIDGKRLSPHKVFLIAAQLSSALSLAHQRGVIHRDLKPENVFLVRDPDVDGGERTKLLDFGLARFLDSSERRTSAGMTLGTPTYMSPEQCLGLDSIDGRTDVYSLGILMYQMLAGVPPFVGEMGRVMRAHCGEPPKPVSMFAPHLWGPAADFVMSLLQKNATLRMTMRQAEQALVGFLSRGELAKEEVRNGAPVPASVAAPTTLLAAQNNANTVGPRAAVRNPWKIVAAASLIAGIGGGFVVGRASQPRTETRKETHTEKGKETIRSQNVNRTPEVVSGSLKESDKASGTEPSKLPRKGKGGK